MSRFCFLLIQIFILIQLSINPSCAQENLNIVYFNDFEPFSWEDQEGQMHGMIIDILREALENRMDISVTHEGYPWARAQILVEYGDRDAFATIPNQERRAYTVISEEPILALTHSGVTYPDNPRLKELMDIKNIEGFKSFSHVQYIGNGWAKTNLTGMDVTWVVTYEEALNLIANKKYDIFLSNTRTIKYSMKKYGLNDRLVELPNTFGSSLFHLCIGKASPFTQILPEFDRTIRKMRDDGTLQKIFQKYE